MGVGDPTLGKQVRRLVGAVSGRVDRWRALLDSDESWSDQIRRSLYLGEDADADAIEHSERELRRIWQRLGDASVAQLMDGRME